MPTRKIDNLPKPEPIAIATCGHPDHFPGETAEPGKYEHTCAGCGWSYTFFSFTVNAHTLDARRSEVAA